MPKGGSQLSTYLKRLQNIIKRGQLFDYIDHDVIICQIHYKLTTHFKGEDVYPDNNTIYVL